MTDALEGVPHRGALRMSLELEPSPNHYTDYSEYAEPHRRAETPTIAACFTGAQWQNDHAAWVAKPIWCTVNNS